MMDLRKKTVFILCATISCLILVLFILSEVVVLEGFSQVEVQSAQKDTYRILVALGDDINTLDAVAYDWASQESTRGLLKDITTKKQWSRLDSDTFERLDFNFILLTDTQGRLVAGKGYDLLNHREMGIPPGFLAPLGSESLMSGQQQRGSGTLGIVSYSEGPVMIAIRPVFSGPDQQDVIGHLVMARYLDDQEISRLSSMAQLPLEIRRYAASDLPEEYQKAASIFSQSGTPFIQRAGKEALTIDAPILILPVDQHTLGTYALIRDISGKPALIMKASIGRTITGQGQSTTLYFILLLIVTGLTFGLITLLLLEKTVISRILNLSNQTNDIGRKQDFSARVDLVGTDEIGGLAANVNTMLGQLETSQHHLQSRLTLSEEKYRLIFNSISDPVIICRFATRNAQGVVLEANDAALALLGYSREDLLSTDPSAVFVSESVSTLSRLSESGSPEGILPVESVFRKHSGEEIPVEVSARSFDQMGEGVVLTISRDISSRKMAETAIRQATKKLNMLNHVTFNDIQNAIYVFFGYRNLVKESLTDPQIAGYLQKEEDSLKRISRALVFAGSYRDLGKNPPAWQDVNQVFLLAASHLDLSLLVRKTSVEGLEIFADPLLETVFFNLCENVVRHADSATQISLSYRRTPANLILIFEDNGPGIPEPMKERIFERTVVQKNTMGLFLAREILEITGITLQETGVYGNGARFEILVPAKVFRFSKTTE